MSSVLVDLNDKLKKAARANHPQVSQGIIGLSSPGKSFHTEPAYVLTYYATPENVIFIDPLMIVGGVIDVYRPPVFDNLGNCYSFASQTTSVNSSVYDQTIFYLPVNSQNPRKRTADNDGATQSNSRRRKGNVEEE